MEFSTLSISGSPFILTLSVLFLVFNAAGVRAIPQGDFGERIAIRTIMIFVSGASVDARSICDAGQI